MLRELSVQNLALIEDMRIELEPGFCAWTGETGAGKTLLLSALGLLLGERGSSDLLRADAAELRVAARFELTKVSLRQAVEAVLQAAVDDQQVILMRRMNSAGRSFAYVNDQPVTLATLRQLGELLVDIHGQRESHSLLQPAYQLQQLDAYGELDETRLRYEERAKHVRELRQRLKHLEADRQQRQRELALIRFEKEELEQAVLVPGEMGQWAREREKLVHAQALQEFAVEVCDRLYDADGAFFEILGRLQRDAEHWAKLDDALQEVAQRIDRLAGDTNEIVHLLRPWTSRTQADPARLEEIDNRLQLLRRLETKYGMPVDALIAHRQSLEAQEAERAGKEENRADLETALQEAWRQLRVAGNDLSKQRRKVARKFSAEVQRHLAELGMAEAKLAAELQEIPLGENALEADVPATGLESVELMLAANLGEPARPLRKVASGGELSRTMLALKTVLAGQDQIGTLIFDEIDANVGGRLGDVLGAKLAALGKTHQVICVTHLPQVASFARHQWSIRKTRKGKRTATIIERLDDHARLDELANMLRGSARGETTRKEAEAMLGAARKSW